MKRSRAADLIDTIRVFAAENEPGSLERIRHALKQYGLPALEACGGEAHSNPFIDNCMRCAPRWGWVGRKEPVT